MMPKISKKKFRTLFETKKWINRRYLLDVETLWLSENGEVVTRLNGLLAQSSGTVIYWNSLGDLVTADHLYRKDRWWETSGGRLEIIENLDINDSTRWMPGSWLDEFDVVLFSEDGEIVKVIRDENAYEPDYYFLYDSVQIFVEEYKIYQKTWSPRESNRNLLSGNVNVVAVDAHSTIARGETD